MRKKTFLKAVSIFACLSILMLSVPGAIASERTRNKTYTYHRIMQMTAMFLSFHSFVNLNVNYKKGDTSSDQTYTDDSNRNRKTKITGTLSLTKGPKKND